MAPFGTGLSYTIFSYAWASQPLYDATSGSARLSVVVTNSGSVAGAEVAQCYLKYPLEAGEPPLVLRGFVKTPVLTPGGTHTASFTLTPRQLSAWDPPAGWHVVSGSFEVSVGSGSRDLRLAAPLVVPA